MKRHMLYIIGEPGVGKTTLVRRLVKGVPSSVHTVPYVSWTSYGDEKVIQLGHDRGVFGGTDALGMAAQKHVLEWLRSWGVDNEGNNYSAADCRYFLAEGDRLANAKFFDAVRAMGFDLQVVVLALEPEELQARRNTRNARIGKSQDDRWLKTRATKVRNLAGQASLVLDASQPTKELAKELRRYAVVKELRKLRRSVAS